MIRKPRIYVMSDDWWREHSFKNKRKQISAKSFSEFAQREGFPGSLVGNDSRFKIFDSALRVWHYPNGTSVARLVSAFTQYKVVNHLFRRRWLYVYDQQFQERKCRLCKKGSKN